jgi:hypothetical protein
VPVTLPSAHWMQPTAVSGLLQPASAHQKLTFVPSMKRRRYKNPLPTAVEVASSRGGPRALPRSGWKEVQLHSFDTTVPRPSTFDQPRDA